MCVWRWGEMGTTVVTGARKVNNPKKRNRYIILQQVQSPAKIIVKKRAKSLVDSTSRLVDQRYDDSRMYII